MGMHRMRCKSPGMAEKELLAYLIAHDLMRCVIAEAVARHQVQPECVSFTVSASIGAANTVAALLKRTAPRCDANSGKTSYPAEPAI
jgi:hypothetical protein